MPYLFVVETSALPSYGTSVAAFRGFEGLSRPYVFELFLAMNNDVGHDVDLGSVVGKPVTLRQEGSSFVRTGIFGSIELVNDFEGRSVFRATMVPRLTRLRHSVHSRLFTQEAVPSILVRVLQSAGITDVALNLRGSYAAEDHICQYRESDLDFISRWMEREGIYYYFEHGDGPETLVLTDHLSSHSPLGDKPIRYRPRVMVAGDFRMFTCCHSSVPSSVRLKDYDYTKPSLDVSGQAAVAGAGFGELSLYGGRFDSPGDGNRLARVKAEGLAAAGVVYHATGAATTLTPGFTFELDEHPRASFNTRYLATEIEHFATQAHDPAELEGLVDFEDTYRAEVKAILATTQYRAPQTTPWPRIYGTEYAVIDGPSSSEYAQIDTHGRYRVKFHFDESDLSKGQASTWVRMLQPHGGGIEGFHFPLRAGTEVMCAFAGGDPDRPAIVGVAPNALTPSPVTVGNKTRNVIQTGGRNRFEFEDLAGQERITMSTPHANTYIRMGAPNDDATIHIASQGTVQTTTASDYNLGATGHYLGEVGGGFDLRVGTNSGASGGAAMDTSTTAGTGEGRLAFEKTMRQSVGYPLASVPGAAAFPPGNMTPAGESTPASGTYTIELDTKGNTRETVTGSRVLEVGGVCLEHFKGDFRYMVCDGHYYSKYVKKQTNHTIGDSDNTVDGNTTTTTHGDNTSSVDGNVTSTVNGWSTSNVYGHRRADTGGDSISTTRGASLSLVAGANVTATLGLGVNAVLGFRHNFSVPGAQHHIIGYNASWTLGLKSDYVLGFKYDVITAKAEIKGMATYEAGLEDKNIGVKLASVFANLSSGMFLASFKSLHVFG